MGRVGGGVQGQRQEDSSSGSCNNSGGKGRDLDNALRVVSVGRHQFQMTQWASFILAVRSAAAWVTSFGSNVHSLNLRSSWLWVQDSKDLLLTPLETLELAMSASQKWLHLCWHTMTCRRPWSLDYSPQGCKESDTIERLSMRGAWTHCITPVRGSACSTAVSMQRPYGFFLVWHESLHLDMGTKPLSRTFHAFLSHCFFLCSGFQVK